MDTKQVTAVIVDRANYGRLLPILKALRDDPRFELRLLLGGSFVLPRFGWPWKMLKTDGLDRVPAERVYHEVDGNCPQSRAQSIGLGICQYAAAMDRLGSPWVVLIGDRYEALAAAQAAVFTGRCLVHFQGGEISATLDEPTRHAITKLAHYHVPATRLAAATLVRRLGEHPEAILTVGCPATDLGLELVKQNRRPIEPDYMLVMYHPDGRQYPGREMDRVLAGCYPYAGQRGLRLRVWWPNIDPSSEQITRKILHHRKRHNFELVRNVHPMNFLHLLRWARVCVGNSSAFVRDAGYFGTPVVNVGLRQFGRERTTNVVTVPCDSHAIAHAIGEQLAHGRYSPDPLYGDGGVAGRFCENLAAAGVYHQKHLGTSPDYEHQRPAQTAPVPCAA